MSSVAASEILRQKQILQLFHNNQKYHEKHDFYKKQISQKNVQTMIDIIIVIQQMLRDDQYNPYSKLLSLRFLKETFHLVSYGMMTLVNSYLIETLLQIALFKKSSKEEDRGQEIFLSYSRARDDDTLLRKVGLSFHKIVLQMYEAISQIIPFCPLNSNKNQIKSNFQSHYVSLKSMHVTFPHNRTYYKQKDVQKISSYYKRVSSNLQRCKDEISNFYKYLLYYKLENPQLYFSTKPILISIIKSGDQYVVDEFITFIRHFISKNIDFKQQKSSTSIDYVDILTAVIRIGDIESIKKIQDHILIPILQQYTNNRLSQKQVKMVCTWPNLVSNIEQQLNVKCDSYREIKNILSFKSQEQPIFFQNNISHQNCRKENNEKKLFFLDLDHSNSEHVKQFIHKYKLQNTQRIKNKQQIVNLPSKKLIIDIDTPKSKIFKRVTKQNAEQSKATSEYHPKTPKSVSSIIKDQFQLLQFQNNYNSVSNFSHQSIRQPKILSGKKRNKKSQSSRSSYGTQSQNKRHEKQKMNFEYYEQKNLKEIRKSKEKQKMLQRQLKEKDELTKRLQIETFSSGSNLDKSERNLKKFSSTQLTKEKIIFSKFPQHSEQSEVKLKTFESLALFSKSQQSNQHKMKKEMLKKKSLLLKNALIQIGLITKFDKKNNVLQCQFFCTPFTSLHTITLRIRCASWLHPFSKDVQTKIKGSPQIQFTIKFLLSCNLYKDPSTYFNKSQLELSFFKQHQNQIIKQSLALPILINKFAQNFQITQINECQKLLPNKQQQMSALIKLNTKICKNFDDFSKYFPQGALLDNPRTFVAFLTAFKIEFYVYLHIVSKYDGILKILPKNTPQQQKDLQILSIFFKSFCYLFSV